MKLFLWSAGVCVIASPALGEDPCTNYTVSTFLEELAEPWTPVPDGSSGAPRQGWLATADGFFTREAHLAFDWTDTQATDSYGGLARFHYPWSKRFWTGVEARFVQSGNGETDFGDIRVTPQVMLIEMRNVSFNAGVGVRAPTGSAASGGGPFEAAPQLNLFTDLGGAVSFRMQTRYDFVGGNEPNAFGLNAALGKTFTRHEAAPFGDFTGYVSFNLREPVSGPGDTFLSVTPGMRTHLGGNLFFLAGVEIPISNRDSFFRQRVIAQLVYGF